MRKGKQVQLSVESEGALLEVVQDSKRQIEER